MLDWITPPWQRLKRRRYPSAVAHAGLGFKTGYGNTFMLAEQFIQCS
nr:K810 [uncultured bacterium]